MPSLGRLNVEVFWKADALDLKETGEDSVNSCIALSFQRAIFQNGFLHYFVSGNILLPSIFKNTGFPARRQQQT